MALLADYTAGTITVSANGTAVTGIGTAWQTAGFKEGDWLIANGWVNVIASVNSNTSLTLAQPWRGGALSGAAYRLRYMSDGSRASAQARQLIDLLGGSGNLEALGGLTLAANKGIHATGAGTLATHDLTPAARAILALAGSSGAKLPVVTGTGTAALRDIVGTVSRSGTVPTGAVVERGSNSNGEYVRFADGTQICHNYLQLGGVVAIDQYDSTSGLYRTAAQIDWTYPASFSGSNTSFTATARRAALSAFLAAVGYNTGSSSASLVLWSSIAIDTAGQKTVNMTATGRWF